MPGTADAWGQANIAQNYGRLYYGVAIPTAGGRITIHTDGTPESVANPSAKHMGMTDEGAEFLIRPSYEDYFSDEFAAPIARNVGDVEAAITAALLAVLDMELAEVLLPGVATYATGSGYSEVSLGTRDIVYRPFALIFPTAADATKFGVYNLYRALNDAGFAAQIGRRKRAATPIAIKGTALTTRAVTDTIGKYFKTT